MTPFPTIHYTSAPTQISIQILPNSLRHPQQAISNQIQAVTQHGSEVSDLELVWNASSWTIPGENTPSGKFAREGDDTLRNWVIVRPDPSGIYAFSRAEVDSSFSRNFILPRNLTCVHSVSSNADDHHGTMTN